MVILLIFGQMSMISFGVIFTVRSSMTALILYGFDSFLS